MERELWPVLYQAVRQVGQQMRQPGVTYPPWVIALVLLWSALHDRPRNWACVACNWSTTTLRPWRLPSESVVSRRANSVQLQRLWRGLEAALRGTACQGWFSIADGKPLFVGGCSKDRQARWGYGAGMRGKGYKLHVIWSNHTVPDAWDLTPLHRQEQMVAQELLQRVHVGGYLLADGNYDTNPLHETAAQRGYQLVAQDRRPNAGRGHRRQSVSRQRSLVLRRTTFGESLLRYRTHLERVFAHAVSFAGGLAPLPAWVRSLIRVRTWVQCKLLINAARLLNKQRLTA